MTRKAPRNSVGEQVLIASAAAIVPPARVQMDANDLGFFGSIIAEFARADWSEHQLELAALLARTMADLELEQRLLREEGTVIKNDRGTPVMNPRRAAVQMYSGSILAFRKTLSLHYRADANEPQQLAASIKARKMVESAVDEAQANAPDDLLARPRAN